MTYAVCQMPADGWINKWRAPAHNPTACMTSMRSGRRKPFYQFRPDKFVPASVGMVHLRHEICQRRAASQFGFEGGKRIHEPDVKLRREIADLLGVLVERVVGLIELRRLIRRGCEQNHLRAHRLRF